MPSSAVQPVLLLTLLAAVSSAQITLPYPCNQSALQQAASGSWLLFPDLGHIGLCELVGAQYCSAYLVWHCARADGSSETLRRAALTKGGPVLGLCVPPPEACSTAELSRAVFAETATSVAFRDLSALLSPGLPATCGNGTYAYLAVDCMNDALELEGGDGAAIAVAVVLCALGALTLLRPLWRAAVHLRRMLLPPADSTSSSSDAEDASQASLLPKGTDPSAAAGYGVAVNAAADGGAAPQTNGPLSGTASRVCGAAALLLGWCDMRSNLEELFKVSSRGTPAIHTQFFEGMRVVAMALIINCHWGYYRVYNNVENVPTLAKFAHSYNSISLYSTIAVDVFFFLSGFLQLHIYFREAAKVHGTKAGDVVQPLPVRCVLKNYLRRYLRLTPTVMLFLVTAVWLVPLVPTGPLRQMYGNEYTIRACHQDWWRVMLFINNLDDGAGWRQCLDWLWYLACDMQMYLVAPLFILPYFVKGIGERLWIGLAVASIVAVTISAFSFNPQVGTGLMETYYDKPYLRCAPYVYGMLTCVLIRRADVRRWLTNPRVRLLLYTVSLGLFLAVINVFFHGFFLITTNQPTSNFNPFSNAFTVGGFGLSLLLVSLPWCCGHGGLLFRFFSHPTFAVLSKLVFASYIVHPVVFLVVAASAYHYDVFSPLLQLYEVGGAVVVTLIAALGLYLVVEVPASKLNDALTK